MESLGAAKVKNGGGILKGYAFKHGAFISLYATSAMQVTPVVLR